MLKEGLVILSPDKENSVFTRELVKGKSHYDLCRYFIELNHLFDGNLEYLKLFYKQAVYLAGNGYVLLQLTSSDYFDVLYLPEKLQIHQYRWLRLRGLWLRKLNLALVSVEEENCLKNYDKWNLNDISVYSKFIELAHSKKMEEELVQKIKRLSNR